MGDSTGGSEPPSTSTGISIGVSPACSASKCLSPLLSPSSMRVAQNISRVQYFDVPTLEELKTLSEELQMIKNQFLDDPEMTVEVAKLMVNVRRTVNRKVSYALTDQGPFMVVMEVMEDKVGNIHPMNMGKHFHQNKVHSIVRITKKGINKIEHGYKKYIPQRLVTCRGLIWDLGDIINADNFYSEAEACVKKEGTLKKIKIINVRRLTKRIRMQALDGSVVFKSVPAKNYLVTFEGKTLPESIIIFKNERVVDKYISLVMMCINCCRFGHWKNQCKRKGRCSFCTLYLCVRKSQFLKREKCPDDHLNPDHICVRLESEVPPKPICIHCSGFHQAA
ncbi:uncharacterized protein LOC132708826 isoform X3 [Cylas formicarius]|uniref:uncharacterized protein LOC132708826 isoform X3 n=1 Tax=Cylas formicarius TaxID=197179 RepID=UPI0029583E8E|nr:uncharacterized protein LOC132708826 isoform X3 [Cylas formicarius]